jgi:hypothetical protein
MEGKGKRFQDLPARNVYREPVLHGKVSEAEQNELIKKKQVD